ncbi:hypothetical protein T4C_1361, partial [Trichinella pseudospiralis]
LMIMITARMNITARKRITFGDNRCIAEWNVTATFYDNKILFAGNVTNFPHRALSRSVQKRYVEEWRHGRREAELHTKGVPGYQWVLIL